jgi:alanyl-tRNA synthetase
VSGKHNDLEIVGPSPRHHTFFEMLGNFSFGDYFKQDAIAFGWSFMTGTMGVDPDRLILTVYRDDEDAYEAWVGGVGVPAQRVLRMGEKTNFWMMADVGPCGPTSEIHYDFGPEHCTCGRHDCSVALDNDCGRWLEVWNLVFMQFDQAADGSRAPLPQTGVDTGMGLERIVAIEQGVYSNYETDLFASILERVQEICGHSTQSRQEHETGYRVLGDHGRAMAFLIADGVLPGNDGRNYVLRLIMRRAMRFGKLTGLDGPFLVPVADAVVDTMSPTYPSLGERRDWIREVIAEEESRFERTLASGLSILDEVIDEARGAGADVIGGREVFRLYDTYGFPPDLTRVVAEERGLSIDRPGFDAAMAEQRERARKGGEFGVAEDGEHYRRLGLPDVEFVGYDETEAVARVVALRVDGESADAAGTSTLVEVVLDRTPFYAEAGGQVGDTGMLIGDEGDVCVNDSRGPVPGIVVHYGVVERGSIQLGDTLTARVDAERRADIMRNHTATHLLHRALQTVLGEHAQQRGSLVAPDRLRFDFAHLKAVTPGELERIGRVVNEMVRADTAVTWETLPLEEARRAGAMMLFGEKYGDTVRMVTVDGSSRELCGGTHLRRTGEIGTFLVRVESSVGAGLRRIEALTGRGAEQYVREHLGELRELAGRLGTPTVEDVPARVEELLKRNRELERELEQQRATTASSRAQSLTDAVVDVGGVPVLAARIDAPDTDVLRGQVDALRDKLGSVVIVLGTVVDGKPRIVAAVTDDLVAEGYHAGELVKQVARSVGGGGGGRPNMAEAGGRDPEALDAALAAVPGHVRAQGKGAGE